MRLLTAKEAARALNVPLSRVYELVRLGILPCVRIGERQIRFDELALREWAAKGGSTQQAQQMNSASAFI
jgi:excisionase family DNA binding protein